MKKIALLTTIILSLAIGAMAQGGGMFQRGAEPEYSGTYGNRDGDSPMLPNHNEPGDQNGNQTTPVGTGIAVLTALGGAYLVAKRRKED